MQFTRPSLLAKVGLICETIDRDEERDGKQREIACEEDEHQEAESVLPVYHASFMNACVSVLESIVTVVYTLLKFIFQHACG